MGRPTQRRGGAWAAVLLALPLLIGMAGDAAAHEVLKHSVPGDGARLDEAPRVLRLTFTRPVELGLTRVELLGPEGQPVALAAPELAADSANVIVVAVRGALKAGDYTVRWRVVGPDGHPVQGSFDFAISPGAAGLAAPEAGAGGAAAPGADAPGARAPVAGAPAGVAGAGSGANAADPSAGAGAAPRSIGVQAFGADAPAYVAIRWFTFLCLVGLIGCVAFRHIVLGAVGRRSGASADALIGPAADRARSIGEAAAWLLLAAAALRLLAQARALGGVEPTLVRELITGTTWGRGWLIQVAGAALAVVGLRSARGAGRAGWAAAAVAALALAVTPALSGHAVAAQEGAALAVVADALHVLGAGGWLGTLALVLAAGIPAALRLESPRRGPAVAALVGAFSPAALCFAAVLVATGLYASVMHLGSVDALFGTAYGRTLLVKLGAIALVFGLGAYNFLRVRPSLGDESGIPRLRRSSAVELAVGVLVLVATALLVATPPAAESAAAAADAPGAVETVEATASAH
ncbi:MAG TPA: copper resistance protein CopC [Longimicrobiales bacterium]